MQSWEQGRRRPECPARVLLKVIEHDPEAMWRASVAQLRTAGVVSVPMLDCKA